MEYKVVVAPTEEPVTLAEARLHLKLTADDSTAEDSLIEMWISGARELAEQYTGRTLVVTTLEAAADAFPEDGVFELPRPPAQTISSVKYTDTAGDEQTIATDAYALSLYGESRRLEPTYGNYWPSTQSIPNAVRIRYVAGYQTHLKAVKSAILLMVGWMNEHRGDEMSADDIQPPAAKALLSALKLWGR